MEGRAHSSDATTISRWSWGGEEIRGDHCCLFSASGVPVDRPPPVPEVLRADVHDDGHD